MRTLVISDLHLGTRPGHDVLQRPAAQARLFAALDGVDRLVLLGDALELTTRNARRATARTSGVALCHGGSGALLSNRAEKGAAFMMPTRFD